MTGFTHSVALEEAINIARLKAKERRHSNYGAPHLLWSLLHDQIGLTETLSALNKDINYLREWADVRIEMYKSPILQGEPLPDAKIEGIWDLARESSQVLNDEKVSPAAALIAVITPGAIFSSEQLKSLTLSPEEIVSRFKKEEGYGSTQEGKSERRRNVHSDSVLSKYCKDKIELAKSGKLDPVVGRDEEKRQMAEILGQRMAPNVMIIGEPGVGKTAIVEGLAQDILNKRAPKHLTHASIFELDITALLAGASYKGEAEDRLKKILDELSNFEKPILFIDEAHVIFDTRNTGSGGLGNLLKPSLARGELILIAATTFQEYRKAIEPDDALVRRFSLLKILEPSEQKAALMVNSLLPIYESHHQLSIHAQVSREAVTLAKRYMKDRRLPSSAIQLLDQTMAALRMIKDTAYDELERIKTDFYPTQNQGEETALEILSSAALLLSKTGPILWALFQNEEPQLVEKLTIEPTIETLLSSIEKLQQIISRLGKEVNPQHLTAIISQRTGIPMGELQAEEMVKMQKIEDYLRKRVIGQDHALSIVSQAMQESRTGLQEHGKPVSFFFLGPTGTGKTELAKSLAEFLFLDEKAILRFDMSEFKEEHSASLLLGAPPGYVGYEEGGLLVNQIRKAPYSIVLFDEIEKAHRSVFDIFLQLLDEGRLRDKLGNEGDFGNSVIIFTSNIGSEWITQEFFSGKIPSTEGILTKMEAFFRPEFMARISDILPFAPIVKTSAKQILSVHLEKLTRQIQENNYSLIVSDAALDVLIARGFSPTLGARPLKSVLRRELRRPLARKIIVGEIKPGDQISIDTDDTGELLWTTEPILKPQTT